MAAELERGAFRVVEKCATGAEAVAAVRERRPDLCVLAQDVPGGATTATLALRALPRPPRVLVLAGGRRPRDVLAALRAGADGWLVAGIDPTGLAASARAVASGSTVLPPELVRDLVEGLHPPADAR